MALSFAVRLNAQNECTTAFLMEMINSLLSKLGTDLAVTTHSRVSPGLLFLAVVHAAHVQVVYALEIVRETFPFETQV